jgi:hypothetical protein
LVFILEELHSWDGEIKSMKSLRRIFENMLTVYITSSGVSATRLHLIITILIFRSYPNFYLLVFDSMDPFSRSRRFALALALALARTPCPSTRKLRSKDSLLNLF